MYHRLRLMAVLVAVLAGLLSACRQGPSVSTASPDPHAWWQHAVFYEIYPRSFADSNQDGIGDLNGITSKLDYLKDLGVDAIWITPCFPSPQVDFGYDVSDYKNIDPMYGTLADFDRLISEAKKRDMRVILDFVINHTSDQHKWFTDSRSSRTAQFRDWYVWRDGKASGKPPNNWISIFGGPAWKLDPKTGQYYYHAFYPEQPDLNWRNPAVKDAMFDITRWWYQRGVAGFRLDAVDTLFEDPQLQDDPVLPGKTKFGDPRLERVFNNKLPQVHEVLQGLRKVADEHGAVLIGETWTDNIDELKQYYGQSGNELQMPMDLMFATVNKVSAPDFRRQIAAADSTGWPVYVISNHDIVRSYVRYGDGQHNDAIAKLMATMYLTLRGSPILYYGEEIGMENNDPKRKEDVQDPIGRRGWPEEKGRDGERTPMQWDTNANAGFSPAKPWLPVPASYTTHNVDSESKDLSSVLSTYRRLLQLRRTNPALREGQYIALNESDTNILAYLRRDKDNSVVVALNMSPTPQDFSLNLAQLAIDNPKLRTLLTTESVQITGPARISLGPFAAFVAEVTR